MPKQASQNENKQQQQINNLKFAKQQSITVPPNDDDLFSLIQKLQSRRLDEQRSEIPKAFNQQHAYSSSSSATTINRK